MIQPKIRKVDDIDKIAFPVTSTQTITVGDAVFASTYIYPCTTGTNDSKFVGFAMDSSASGDSEDVVVATKGYVEIDVASASYRIPAGLSFSATNTLSDDGGSNTVAWVAQNTSSATRLLVFFNAPALQKKFEVNA